MKKVYFALGLILLAALLPLSICIDQSPINQKIPSGRGPVINFQLGCNTSFDNVDKSPIYKIVPNLELTKFNDIVDAFNMSGIPQFSINNRGDIVSYWLHDNEGLLKYWLKTGMIDYSSSDAYPTVSEQPKLPSDKRAIEIATDFLKENGLLNDNLKYYSMSNDYQRLCNKTSGEIIQEFILTKWIYFREEIDGTPIVGAGGATVAIGGDDKVVAFTAPQRTFEKIGEKPVIQIQDVLSHIQSGKGFLSMPRAPLGGRNITITNISLVYYAGSIPEGNDGNLLIPSYYLDGKLEDTGERMGFYVKAI